MDFGSKYKFEPKQGPSPDKYRIKDPSKPKIKMGIIHHETSPYRRGPDILPAPGHTFKHEAFASNITHSMNFGDKYKPFKSETPSCTKYNPDDSFLSTRHKSPSATIRQPTMLAADQDLLPTSPPQYQERSFQSPK
jgi:hypothetical protein